MIEVPGRDMRPKLGFWAPGHYLRGCILCDGKFIGDKRAQVCADCAYVPGNSSLLVRGAIIVSGFAQEMYAKYLMLKVRHIVEQRKKRQETGGGDNG